MSLPVLKTFTYKLGDSENFDVLEFEMYTFLERRPTPGRSFWSTEHTCTFWFNASAIVDHFSLDLPEIVEVALRKKYGPEPEKFSDFRSDYMLHICGFREDSLVLSEQGLYELLCNEDVCPPTPRFEKFTVWLHSTCLPYLRYRRDTDFEKLTMLDDEGDDTDIEEEEDCSNTDDGNVENSEKNAIDDNDDGQDDDDNGGGDQNSIVDSVITEEQQFDLSTKECAFNDMAIRLWFA